jgi:hypothetical protein
LVASLAVGFVEAALGAAFDSALGLTAVGGFLEAALAGSSDIGFFLWSFSVLCSYVEIFFSSATLVLKRQF